MTGPRTVSLPGGPHMPSSVRVAALTDIGLVRKNNEDFYGYDHAHGLYVVCDGMGGMAAGEVASRIACSTAIEAFVAQPAETPAYERLTLALRSANAAVRLASSENEQHGMGTTLVCALVEDSKLLIGNVGDSRAYLIREASPFQVTVDHSYINELVRDGTLTAEDIPQVNLKGMESVITRAIGAADEIAPDFYSIDLKHDDAVLLASDGLTRYVDSDRFSALIDLADLDASCTRLVEAAKDAGGADNITCILLHYDASLTGG